VKKVKEERGGGGRGASFDKQIDILIETIGCQGLSIPILY